MRLATAAGLFSPPALEAAASAADPPWAPGLRSRVRSAAPFSRPARLPRNGALSHQAWPQALPITSSRMLRALRGIPRTADARLLLRKVERGGRPPGWGRRERLRCCVSRTEGRTHPPRSDTRRDASSVGEERTFGAQTRASLVFAMAHPIATVWTERLVLGGRKKNDNRGSACVVGDLDVPASPILLLSIATHAIAYYRNGAAVSGRKIAEHDPPIVGANQRF
jgi:hypothetical protein